MDLRCNKPPRHLAVAVVVACPSLLLLSNRLKRDNSQCHKHNNKTFMGPKKSNRKIACQS